MTRRKVGKRKEVKIDFANYSYLLDGIAGIGKEQPISEPVLLEKGWTPIGEVKIGDKIYGEDGNLYTVTGIFPQGIKDVYEIIFSDDTKTRCGLEHLWHIHTRKQRINMKNKNDYRFQIKSLKDIMIDYKNIDYYKYSIPINSEIKFTEKENLPLDPYIFGLLLGDGGFTKSVITFTNPETELFEQLEQGIKELDLELHYRDFENHRQATIVKNDNEKYNKLNTIINNLGLSGCDSRQKFIPKQYIYSKIEDRIKLLSGIINTDGHIHKNVSIHVCSYSEQLAKDVTELARSLGYIAIFNSWDRTNENSTKKYEKEIEYRVTIIGDYSKLNLSTKHKNKLKERCNDYCKSIIDIQLVGQEESICIMVDNPNHLYITNDYIVTHNTTLAYEVGKTLYGEDGIMILTVGQEPEPDHLGGVLSDRAETWEDLTEMVDDLVTYRNEDYKDLKMIAIDTVDELFRLAEEEVVNIYNASVVPEKRVKSIKQAYGGFQGGENKVVDLVISTIFKLRDAKYGIFFIGHTKQKNKKDIMTDIEYEQLTSNLEAKYYNAIKDKVNIVACAYIEREMNDIETVKDAFSKKNKQVGRIASERRVIVFRDEEYAIDVKSHFIDIEPKIEFDTNIFINTILTAIKKQHEKYHGKISDKELKQIKEKQETERIIESEVKSEDIKKELDNVSDEERNKELVKKITSHYKIANPEQKQSVKDILEKNGTSKFDLALPTKVFEEILHIFE